MPLISTHNSKLNFVFFFCCFFIISFMIISSILELLEDVEELDIKVAL